MKIQKTKYFSYKLGELPTGCKMCVKGEKLVLFITGICNRNCFYCPLSEQKKGKDVIYANEWETKPNQFQTIIKEAKLCNAKGAGITGGDPLLVNKRTVNAIKKLKKAFGKKFHIHLYTSLNNITEAKLKDLYKAGLDEIRFHPVIENDFYWPRIALAKKFNWDVGVEIPAIPGYEKQTKKLIEFLDGNIDFLNLNEIEMSDTNVSDLAKKGFKIKNNISYAVKGSEELALKLMQYISEKQYKFKVHYCTCRLKDAVQLAQRIKKRAKNTALKYDIITEAGTLIRGAIYLPELYPTFNYRKKLKSLSSKKRLSTINKLNKMKKELKIDCVVDEQKLRLLTSSKILRNNKSKLKSKHLLAAIVEEYPTRDAIEIEIDPI